MSQTVNRTISLAPDPAYWQALGEFVEAFAHIEHVLFNHLMLASRVSPEVAKALFSGTRALDAIAYVRRIWQIAAPVNKAELEDIFAQITAINTVRNSVVHYATIVTSDEGRISTNWGRALTPAHIREHRVTAELLSDMTADLSKASLHLITFWNSPTASLDYRSEEVSVLADAWRYTRP